MFRLLLVLFFLFSCKTSHKSSSSEFKDFDNDNQGYSDALAQAADELRQKEDHPLNEKDELSSILGQDRTNFRTFQELRKQHVILYFHKDTGITTDDRRGNNRDGFQPDAEMFPIFSTPVEYSFNAVLLNNCFSFINVPGFNEINKDFFAPMPPDQQKALFCAALKFEPINDRRVNRHKGDVERVLLYLDSFYRPYGLDQYIYTDKKNLTEISTDLDPADSVGSRLDIVPYDLPNLYILSRMLINKGDSPLPNMRIENSLSFITDPYVQKQLAEKNAELCHGQKVMVLEYKEKFGLGSQRAAWCMGDSWPTVIENSKFLAVLIKKPN